MKLSLPIKLGIFVVLLFAVVIATCLLWTPVKVRYYSSRFCSNVPAERVKGLEGLLACGRKGIDTLAGILSGGMEEAEFVYKCWQYRSANVPRDCNVYHDPFLYERPAFHLACERGYSDTVRLILDCGIHANLKDRDRDTPLHRAAYYCHFNIVKLLVENGADVNSQNYVGVTPLQNTALGTKTSIAELLIKKGAEVNANYNGGQTPLHEATERSTKEMVELLIRNGAKLDAKNYRGHSPLWGSLRDNRKDILLLLIERGADANDNIKHGFTPLHWAAGCRQKAVIRILIENGAEVNVLCKKRNETALDIALSAEIESLLRAHGGRTEKEIREQENKETRQ